MRGAAMRRGRSRRGGRGGGGIISSIVAIIVALVLIVLFCRVTGVHDLASLWEFAEGEFPQSQKLVDRAINEAAGREECNVLKDDGCTRIPGAGNKGWKQKDKDGSSGRNTPQKGNKGGSDGSGGNSGQGAGDNGQGSSASALEAKLDTLTVAAGDHSKYARTDYRHWITQNGSCDTRDIVLKNAGFASNPRTCAGVEKPGFVYTEPYSGKKVSNPKKLDIDHTIPLEYVNQHGGAAWDPQRKQQFANDFSQLVAVDASANRQKGSKGPGEWMPDNKDDHCRYATIWVDTASKYGVSITQKDKDALRGALQTCR